MIGLDTNIIIRYLTQDDLQQSEYATQIIENELNADNQGFISLVVIVEIIWGLICCYKQIKSELLPIINQLLMTKQFKELQILSTLKVRDAYLRLLETLF